MRILLILLMPVLSHASDNWQDIRSIENSMLHWKDAVYVRGSWSTSTNYPVPRTPKVNAVQIRCSRSAMTCVESVAHVEQVRGGNPGSPPYLSGHSFTYEVKSWGGETITAVRTNPHGDPVDESFTIELKSGRVQKSWKAHPLEAVRFSLVSKLLRSSSHIHLKLPLLDSRTFHNPSLQRTCASSAGWSAEFKRYAMRKIPHLRTALIAAYSSGTYAHGMGCTTPQWVVNFNTAVGVSCAIWLVATLFYSFFAVRGKLWWQITAKLVLVTIFLIFLCLYIIVNFVGCEDDILFMMAINLSPAAIFYIIVFWFRKLGANRFA